MNYENMFREKGMCPKDAPCAAPASARDRGRSADGQSPYQDSGFQKVRLKQNLSFEGWNSQAHGESPRKFESSNLNGREIGRSGRPQR